MSGPAASAAPLVAAQAARARARSAGRGYRRVIIAIEAGRQAAAAAPSTIRSPIRVPRSGAAAESSEPSPKIAIPARWTRWAPNRSATAPADNSSAASATV